MKILVTGGTGFLGAYLIKALVEKGYLVRAIKRSNKLPFYIEPALFEKVEWVEGDVLDIISLDAAMEGIDQVIHSAAIVAFHKDAREEMYRVNVDGTANVVNLCIEHGIKKLVHISSIAALGRTKGGSRVDEEKKWVESSVNTHYAISKKKAEMEVWRGVGEGLEAVIANPSTILGYGNWNQGSCSIFRRIYNQFTWYTDGINGFVDVEDVATAVILLMEQGDTGHRYIVNGENWEFRKLFETIARGFGKQAPSRQAGPMLSGLAWRMEKVRSLLSGRKPLLTRETARIAQSKTYFLNDKLLKALPGFSFTPLEEAVLKACKKYEEALEKGVLKA